MKHRCVILADRHQDMLEGIRGLLHSMFETVVMVAERDSLFEAPERLKPNLAVALEPLETHGASGRCCQQLIRRRIVKPP